MTEDTKKIILTPEEQRGDLLTEVNKSFVVFLFTTVYSTSYTKNQKRKDEILMKKKIIALLAAMTLTATALAGCGSDGGETTTESTEAASSEEASTEDAYATGNEGRFEGEHFIVGMSVGYPNFEEYDVETGEAVGLDIDILNYMSEDLGFTYEISDMKLPQIVAGLQAGQLDLSISGMYETEERTEVIDMSESYLTAKSAMIIRKTDEDTITSTVDLNGKTTCCTVGEAYYESLLPTIEGAAVVEYDDNSAAVQAILGGQADAYIIDGATARDICEEYSDLSYFMLDDSMLPGIDGNHYSMGFVKGSGMKEIFDAEIEKMKANGKLKEIISKWLGEDMYDFD